MVGCLVDLFRQGCDALTSRLEATWTDAEFGGGNKDGKQAKAKSEHAHITQFPWAL